MVPGHWYSLVATTFGHLGIVWTHAGLVCRIYLPDAKTRVLHRIAGEFPSPHEISTCRGAILCRCVERYFMGKKVRFDVDALDWSRVSLFQRLVLQTEHVIPYGKVSSYGALARAIGSPQAARAIGSALAGNPFPIVIPCHRTVRGDGSCGGFQGGPDMKRRLLELEGVRFLATGKVAPECFV